MIPLGLFLTRQEEHNSAKKRRTRQLQLHLVMTHFKKERDQISCAYEEALSFHRFQNKTIVQTKQNLGIFKQTSNSAPSEVNLRAATNWNGCWLTPWEY